MARKVKCALTGEQGTDETFVKINGRWYKSLEIYNEDRLNKESYSKAKDLVFFELLGHESGDKYPNFLTKMLREFGSYGNVVILRTLEENKDFMLNYISSHEFNTDVGKLQFISAILSNNLNDVRRKVRKEKEELKKLEKSSEEFDITLEGMNTSIEQTPKQKVKDVTSFLKG